ncbi:protein Diedel [Drosophila elegans]|uniref:protein Diedel n=1 Tax=Drosophila elegans TaxID=30023 RepID=UPI0007E80F3F|nr:protein Diedel [Drosophila elegans]
MRLLSVSSLLIAILWLACFDGANAECCTTVAKLDFNITNGVCGQVNAIPTRRGCTITVCGDGKALVGSLCGRGPCNIFGCNCDDGCLYGSYGESFLARNRRFDIHIKNTEMVEKNTLNSILEFFLNLFY